MSSFELFLLPSSLYCKALLLNNAAADNVEQADLTGEGWCFGAGPVSTGLCVESWDARHVLSWFALQLVLILGVDVDSAGAGVGGFKPGSWPGDMLLSPLTWCTITEMGASCDRSAGRGAITTRPQSTWKRLYVVG